MSWTCCSKIRSSASGYWRSRVRDETANVRRTRPRRFGRTGSRSAPDVFRAARIRHQLAEKNREPGRGRPVAGPARAGEKGRAAAGAAQACTEARAATAQAGARSQEGAASIAAARPQGGNAQAVGSEYRTQGEIAQAEGRRGRAARRAEESRGRAQGRAKEGGT